jgi:hypothetical protein
MSRLHMILLLFSVVVDVVTAAVVVTAVDVVAWVLELLLWLAFVVVGGWDKNAKMALW